MRSSPVCLRRRCARFFNIIGPYVSGKKNISGDVAPAKMAPTQKPQFQLITVMYPDIGGPRMGPNVVAAYADVSLITIP
jgi:hypothetical protein